MRFVLLLLALALGLPQAAAQDATARGPEFALGSGAVGGGDRWAVVVGVSEYADPGIPDLSYAHRDAEEVARFLQEQAGFDSSRVFTLTDAEVTNPRLNATLARVRNSVQEDDLVLFFFAGHGDVASDMGQAFLLTHDVDPEEYSINAYPTFMLLSQVRAIRGKGTQVVLALDACRSGALTGGEQGRQWTHQAFEDLQEASGDVSFFMSSRASQVSHEGPMWGGGHGVFTHVLLEGLRGGAVDFQNRVTLYDLGDYVEREVRRAVGERGLSPQIPQPLPADAHLELAVVAYPEQYAYEPNLTASGDGATAGRGGAANVVEGPFWDALREGRLLPPADSSAWDLYHRALDAGDAEVATMRDELYIALLLDADRLVTRYLRGGDSQPGAEANRYAAAQVAHALRLTTEDDPERPWLEAKRLFLQARAVEEAGDSTVYKQGIADLRRSLELNPTAAYPHNALGTLLMEMGRHEDAEAALHDALRLSPTWELPQHTIGALQEAQGRFEAAAAEYRRAIEIDPNTATSYLALAKLYAGPLEDPAAGEALAARIADRFRRDGLVDLPARLPAADPEPLDVFDPHGEPLRVWLPPYVDASIRSGVRETLHTIPSAQVTGAFAEADYYLEESSDAAGYVLRRADSAPLQLLPSAFAPIQEHGQLAKLAGTLARVKAWLTVRRPATDTFPLEILGLERQDGALFLADSTGTLTLPPNDNLCYTDDHPEYRPDECYRVAVGVREENLDAFREAAAERYAYLFWVDHQGDSCLLSPFARCDPSAAGATAVGLADAAQLRPYRGADGGTVYLLDLRQDVSFNMRSGPFGRNLLALVTTDRPLASDPQAFQWAEYGAAERRAEGDETIEPGAWDLHRIMLDVVLGAEATPVQTAGVPNAPSRQRPVSEERPQPERRADDSYVAPVPPAERPIEQRSDPAPPAGGDESPEVASAADDARLASIQRWTRDLRPPPGAAGAFPLEALGLQRASDGLVLRPDGFDVLTIPPTERPCYPESHPDYRPEDCYRLAIGLTPEARASLDGRPEHRGVYAYATFVDPEGEACLLLPFVGCAPERAAPEALLDLAALALAPTASGDSVWVADLGERSIHFAFRSEPYGRSTVVLLTTADPFEGAAREMQWDAPGAPATRSVQAAPDIAELFGLHRLHIDVVPGAPAPTLGLE